MKQSDRTKISKHIFENILLLPMEFKDGKVIPEFKFKASIKLDFNKTFSAKNFEERLNNNPVKLAEMKQKLTNEFIEYLCTFFSTLRKN